MLRLFSGVDIIFEHRLLQPEFRGNNIMFGLCVKIVSFTLAKCGGGDIIMFGKCGDVCETTFDGRAN